MPLYIDPVNFNGPLYGNGNAVIARSALKVMGDKFIYIGVSLNPSEIGKLIRKKVAGKDVYIFSVGLSPKNGVIRIIPENLRFSFQVLRYLRELISFNDKYIFTRTYTIVWLFALLKGGWNICYYIPGLGNPMTVGRRKAIGKYLEGMYNYLQSRALSKVDVLFAAASDKEIENYRNIMEVKGKQPEVLKLPTAVDVDLFYPQNKELVREEIGLDKYDKVLVFVGRLAAVKGIPLILDSLVNIRKKGIDACLALVGDGELAEELRELAKKKSIDQFVIFYGNQEPFNVSKILAAADVFVMSSYTEGFSNAMVEAVASGRPIVSTNVSGVSDLIIEGENGYIVYSRSPIEFSDKILKSFSLTAAEQVSRNLALRKYSDEHLWDSIQHEWRA